MGYLLSSLANLPVESDVNFYIFVINGGWRGGTYELIEQNFVQIAKEIGPNAVIAKGFDQSWTDQVAEKYLGKDYRSMQGLLPALLITDAHPDNLNDQSLRLLVPLSKIDEKFGGPDAFFSLLIRFANDGDQEFVTIFQQKEESVIEAGASMLELKPNFCGIGINLNEIAHRIARHKAHKQG